MGGVYGIDFKVLEFIFDMLGVPDQDRPATFQKIMVIESVASTRRKLAREEQERRDQLTRGGGHLITG